MRWTRKDNPDVRLFQQVLLAYAQGDARGFNEKVAAYRQRIDKQIPADARLSTLEVFFNDFKPFLVSMVLYVIVFLLSCVVLLVFRQNLNRAAFWLAVLALLVHSLGLLSRMWIQGRPPVTNLYSSAIFVGWGCLVLCWVWKSCSATALAIWWLRCSGSVRCSSLVISSPAARTRWG